MSIGTTSSVPVLQALVDRPLQANYHPAMSNPVIIKELPYDPEFERVFLQAERNMVWLSEHAEELGIFKLHRGRYVAAAGGELFVADTAQEVERLARAKHPDEVPHVRYIPREKAYRIYANQWQMVALR